MNCYGSNIQKLIKHQKVFVYLEENFRLKKTCPV